MEEVAAVDLSRSVADCVTVSHGRTAVVMGVVVERSAPTPTVVWSCR